MEKLSPVDVHVGITVGAPNGSGARISGEIRTGSGETEAFGSWLDLLTRLEAAVAAIAASREQSEKV